MLKKLSGIALSAATYLSLATPTFAATATFNLCPAGDTGTANFSALCYLDPSNLPGLAITIVFILAIIIALVYLIWGGIKWILSGGDKGKIDAARASIVAAIVGLVIIFLAYFILSIVVPIFVPGFSFNSLKLPSVK